MRRNVRISDRMASLALVLALLMLVLPAALTAQVYEEYPYPTGEFRNPTGIEWRLSGTFGEPRGNHFHAGSDVRTGGTVGYKLYAIGDGYVARIRVSPFGYGKALYIAHPNGYTSVYAHMDSFSPRIDSLVRARQYRDESFDQDIYLEAAALPVIEGEVIGLSGNSGGSAGPHLHFEIRETASQHALNPLFFGYAVADSRPPDFLGVRITSVRSGFYDRRDVTHREYYPASSLRDTLRVPAGKLAIGAHGYDRQDGGENKNGVFRMETLADGELISQWTMDRLSFDEGRYVNAFRDFEDRQRSRTVYNAFRLPGNRLGVYESLAGDGFIDLGPGQVRRITVRLYDFHRNLTERSFTVLGMEPAAEKEEAYQADTAFHVRWDTDFSWQGEDFRIYLPAGSLYDDAYLVYRADRNDKPGNYSPVHQWHDTFVPLHKQAVVQVAAPVLPQSLRDKAVLVHRDLNGKEQALTTFWKDGLVSARCNEVGSFTVRADTVAPTVTLLNFNGKTRTFRGNQIRVRIADNLSGIDTYRGEVDGKWVLFDYDAKRNLLVYDFDEYCPPGEHTLRLVVTDGVKNLTELKQAFLR